MKYHDWRRNYEDKILYYKVNSYVEQCVMLSICLLYYKQENETRVADRGTRKKKNGCANFFLLFVWCMRGWAHERWYSLTIKQRISS